MRDWKVYDETADEPVRAGMTFVVVVVHACGVFGAGGGVRHKKSVMAMG